MRRLQNNAAFPGTAFPTAAEPNNNRMVLEDPDINQMRHNQPHVPGVLRSSQIRAPFCSPYNYMMPTYQLHHFNRLPTITSTVYDTPMVRRQLIRLLRLLSVFLNALCVGFDYVYDFLNEKGQFET